MKLYHLQVPIPNYEGNGIFFQDIFWLGNHCPNQSEWLRLINDYHDRDKQYPEYTGDWQKVADAVIIAEEFPNLGGRLVGTCTFIETKFGKQPLSLNVRNYGVFKP